MTIKSTDSGSSTGNEQNTSVSTELARQKLEFKIHVALGSGTSTLIDAPTSLGKTFQVATTPWRDFPEVTGGEPVIHLHETSNTRDEAAKVSEEAGIECANLKSGLDICPVALGKYDSQISVQGGKPSNWLRIRVHQGGYPFHSAHKQLERELGSLPCSDEGGCPSTERWDDLPRNDDGSPTYDVIHATHEFAYVEPLIEDTNVVFDERPSFSEEADSAKRGLVQKAVNHMLADFNGSWAELVLAVCKEDEAQLDRYQHVLSEESKYGNRNRSRYTYKETRNVAKAVTRAEPLIPGLRYLGAKDGVSVVLDGQGTLRQIHRPPDLSESRCIIGLDAHPSPLLWRLNTNHDLTLETVLNPIDRKQWRKVRRGLRLVQVGTDTRAYTRGWRGRGQQKAKCIIEKLRRRYEENFSTAISSRAIESDVRRMLVDEGVETPDTMHYGDLKSRNDFEDETVGLLVGCIDPGDDRILDWLALCGLRALPEEENGERKYGRKFIGPDSDAASELLASVRENNLAQAAGRYARNSDFSTSGATVYVWSSALPDQLTDETVPGVVSRVTSRKQEVAQFVLAEGEVTKKEVADVVDISPTYAYNVLQEMAEQGVVSVSKGTGYNGADEYQYVEGTIQQSVNLGL